MAAPLSRFEIQGWRIEEARGEIVAQLGQPGREANNSQSRHPLVCAECRIAAVFSPSSGLVIVFWQLRAFFSMMDVPTRDSYTMSVVQPHERVAMAGMNTVGRSVTGVVAPLASTALWQAFSASVPIIGCAVLKITYDLSLFFMFRKVRAPHEASAARRRGATEVRQAG